MKHFTSICLVSFLVLVPTGLMAKSPVKSGYHILQPVYLQGDAGWDDLTVDDEARRLYVSHGDKILVLDADNFYTVGEIDTLDHCHGIAIAPEFHRGFVTSGGDGKVVVFDTRTLKRKAVLGTEIGVDGILYDSMTKSIYAFNGESGHATVIDAESMQVVTTLALGGKPEGAAVDGKGRLYVDLEDKDQVVELNTAELTILRRLSTAPGKQPAGLAMDAQHGRLFVACRNQKLVVLDLENGKRIKTLPIGKGVDGAAFDSATGNLFTSNGDGTLTVIHEDAPNKYHVVENAKTEQGARTMVFDYGTGRIITDTAEILPSTPVPGESKQHRQFVPGSFHLLVVGIRP
jgi:YVTN family beta-propeller protein